MFWSKHRKEAERLQNENWRLRGELRNNAKETVTVLRERDDARVNAAKIRARSRALRKEQRRLRALLDQHGIAWRTDLPDGAEPSTST
jgi:hypothetical protein